MYLFGLLYRVDEVGTRKSIVFIYSFFICSADILDNRRF